MGSLVRHTAYVCNQGNTLLTSSVASRITTSIGLGSLLLLMVHGRLVLRNVLAVTFMSRSGRLLSDVGIVVVTELDLLTAEAHNMLQ